MLLDFFLNRCSIIRYTIDALFLALFVVSIPSFYWTYAISCLKEKEKTICNVKGLTVRWICLYTFENVKIHAQSIMLFSKILSICTHEACNKLDTKASILFSWKKFYQEFLFVKTRENIQIASQTAKNSNIYVYRYLLSSKGKKITTNSNNAPPC